MERITIDDRTSLFGENAKYRNHNLFIEAGAGAGKTDTVIKKVIDQLSQGIEPERFVVITFTNKATEELMLRIYNGIIKNRNETKDENLKIVLDNAIKKLYKMNISTIHSFCNSLLNSNSFKAKLSYGANLIEEDEEVDREMYIYNHWIRTLSKSEIDLIAKQNIDNPFKSLRNTYKSLCIAFDDAEPVTKCYLPLLDILTLLDIYQKEVKFYPYQLSAAGETFVTLIDKLFALGNNLISIEKAIRNSDENITLFKEVYAASIKNVRFTYGKIKDPSIREEVDQINEELSKQRVDLNKFIKAVEMTEKLSSTQLINEYAVKAWNYYKENRDREYLCNNQLIYEAYKLLDDEEITSEIANKYDVIYIDEFQDTDRCQVAFLIKLALAIDKRKEKEGKQTTSLIVVGDPKQSIYRFRGADFETYLKTQNEFVSFGKNNKENNFISVFFPDNFRSSNLVVNFVNKVYSNNSDGSSKFYPGYLYEPMKYRKEVPLKVDEKTLGGVYNFDFAIESNKENKFPRLAKFIKYLCDQKNGYKLALPSINNKDGTEIRPIKPSDFLVLTTSHTQMNKYIKAFNKEGLKCLVAGEYSLSFSIINRYLFIILSYLYNKDKNNLENIKRLFLSQGINDIDKHIADIENKTSSLSPFGVFTYILNNFDFVLPSFSRNDEYITKASIEQLFELLALKANTSNVEILNKLEKVLNEDQKSQIVLSKDDDCISLMNVHQSKGLEGNIVIMADSGSLAPTKGNVSLGKKVYLNNKDLYPSELEKINNATKQEKVRLEYVAMTRARHMLIFESSYNSKGLFGRAKNDVSFTYDFSSLIKETDHLSPLPKEEDIYKDIENEDTTFSKVSLCSKEIDQALKVKTRYEITPSSLEIKDLEKTNTTYKARRPMSNIFGNCLHNMMELYVKNTYIDKSKLINHVIVNNKSDIKENEISWFKNSLNECLLAIEKLFKEKDILKDSTNIEPEFKFIYKDENNLINGSMDLLIIKKDKAIIIDYKSDIASYQSKEQFEELLNQTYINQIQMYKNTVNKLLHLDNVETHIVWVEEKENNSIAHLLTLN